MYNVYHISILICHKMGIMSKNAFLINTLLQFEVLNCIIYIYDLYLDSYMFLLNQYFYGISEYFV